MSPEEWGLVIQRELTMAWMERMSPPTMARFEKIWPCAMDAIPESFYTLLDEEIIHQTETLGWRITLSEMVKFRLSRWDHKDNGPELVRRFDVAWQRSILIIQGKALPPMTDVDFWHLKQETVVELRMILNSLRTVFARLKRKPSIGDVLAAFSKCVSESPATYRHLNAKLKLWRAFLTQNKDVCLPILMGDRASPAAIFDQFIAWPAGFEPESVRQKISRLRPAAKL
jgi:hypothetical protein